MKVAIAGGSGFIGHHVIELWIKRGFDVVLISRSHAHGHGSHSQVKTVTWDTLAEHRDLLEGLDGLVNLAGESINQRWTAAAKKRILQSRLTTTRQIAELVDRLERKPKVVVNGSAVGYYGYSETASFVEESGPVGEDFLQEVVRQWEAEADQIPAPRVVKLRTGVVLGLDGGALPKMFLPYKLGAGGKVGSGQQWLSWIHVADMAELITFCIENERVQGPLNAVAPQPVTNDEFGRTLGRAAKRPHWLSVPGFAMRLLFGEMADLLLRGQRVLPQQAQQAGYAYQFPTLQAALQDLVGAK